ncbi:MAG: M2 family metallopeptidase [Thermoguttaceae bacterium]|jgi:peptidyl-dipeptidase A
MSLSQLAFSLGLTLLAVSIGPALAADTLQEDNDARARRFIKSYEEAIRPMEIEVSRRWWDANVSGKDADYQRKAEAEARLEVRLSEPGPFAELKAIRRRPIGDGLAARQIAVLYLEYLPRQVDPELLKRIIALSNQAEQQFSVFRAVVEGRELTDNEIRRVLRESKDSARRRAVWEASKQVGRLLEPKLRRLVKLRNEAARRLGFKDYHVMQLAVGEQSQEQVLKLFDELDGLTREPFRAAKAEIDAILARDYGIPTAALRPWHYHDPFFQESPEVFGRRGDDLYAALDIQKLCREFYAGIGLPIDDVLQRSDLYERKGKNPHAFCTDIDRQGDVRVLANIVPDKMWLGTMLHELGHATYSSKNIPARLPYALRAEAHILSTEAVAMMFEKLADDAGWLRAMGVAVPDPQGFRKSTVRVRRNRLLIFSRWCQVMFRFEKELYANPDQELGRLWWDLVERYQEVRRPEGRNEPDYASKIHLVMSPAYYHNYMLGELFAAQMHHSIAREVLGGVAPAEAVYVGHPAVGRYMRERVYVPGRTLDWQQLSRHATGADLNAQAFAEDIREE